jgi:hypothetical protein
LQNDYSHEELSIAVSNPLSVLHGADSRFYSAAVALGLKAKSCAILRNEIGKKIV